MVLLMISNSFLGKFIVFEGLDGSGQSTQAAKLVEYLNRHQKKLEFGRPRTRAKLGTELVQNRSAASGSGPEAHLTKEPTNNLIGGLIRGQLTNNWKTGPECLQLLFAADRAHHLEKEVIPILEKGGVVISDRYFFSTIAYGSLEIPDWQWLKDINKHFLAPDLSIFLKVSPKVCIERIKGNRFEMELFEKEEALAKIWEGYERIVKEYENIYIVDGEREIDEIFEEIKKIIHEKLNLNGGSSF